MSKHFEAEAGAGPVLLLPPITPEYQRDHFETENGPGPVMPIMRYYQGDYLEAEMLSLITRIIKVTIWRPKPAWGWCCCSR